VSSAEFCLVNGKVGGAYPFDLYSGLYLNDIISVFVAHLNIFILQRARIEGVSLDPVILE